MKIKYPYVENKSQAIWRILEIAQIEDVDVQAAKAMLCDMCEYCIYNDGKCLLEEEVNNVVV